MENGFQAALAKLPPEARQDLTFENVQARIRTLLLMSRGFVVGTADLSELALGWSTYNADHMSMYNPNCSIPKTLVKFLVHYVAMSEFPAGAVRDTLLSIVATTISPELLPASAAGEIEQSTEATLGPYELHDFILFNAIRCGYLSAEDPLPERARHIYPALSARPDRAHDANVLHAILPPAIQALVRSRRTEGRHRQPLSPRRLADAQRCRPGGVAEVEVTANKPGAAIV